MTDHKRICVWPGLSSFWNEQGQNSSLLITLYHDEISGFHGDKYEDWVITPL
jgi:hypothetical protein